MSGSLPSAQDVSLHRSGERAASIPSEASGALRVELERVADPRDLLGGHAQPKPIVHGRPKRAEPAGEFGLGDAALSEEVSEGRRGAHAV